MSRAKLIIIILFSAAIIARFGDAFRPLNQASWRECDIGSIARNFAVEGMNPLLPRIDWRGQGPGYAEMEFPAYPWLIAVTYKAFGVDDMFARLWSLAFSILTLFAFYRLAREYLSRFYAAIAFAFFAFAPLIFDASTSVQPEGLTISAYIAGVYFFVRWLRNDKLRDLFFAAILISTTLLAKATAAHVGLLFAILLYEKFGYAAIKNIRLWLFGAISVIPAAVWYIYAKSIWNTYGNSLGVSNEYHWIGSDFFTNPYFITGILRNEIVYVWAIFGIVAAAFGVIHGFRERTARFALAWFASIFVFLLVAARTTADDWASYYHIYATAPAALLFAFGFERLWRFARNSADTFSSRTVASNLLRLAFILLVIASGFSAFLTEVRAVRAGILSRRIADPSFEQAATIKPKLIRGGLILATGGNCRDSDGYRLAYNASYMFYWLERRGFNVCVEELSIDNVRTFAGRGAQYFVAQRSYLAKMNGSEAGFRSAFQVTAETPDFVVFDLQP